MVFDFESPCACSQVTTEQIRSVIIRTGCTAKVRKREASILQIAN